MVKTFYLEFHTQGRSSIVNITEEITKLLRKSQLQEGILNINCIGSTCALTTLEYEPALVKDLQDLVERLIPASFYYRHNDTWGDDNGHSHLRSCLWGTSLSLAVSNGKLEVGTWQQVVFIDFDIRPRQRKVVLKFIGE